MQYPTIPAPTTPIVHRTAILVFKPLIIMCFTDRGGLASCSFNCGRWFGQRSGRGEMNEQNGVEEEKKANNWSQVNGEVGNESYNEDSDSEENEDSDSGRAGYVLLTQEPSSDEDEHEGTTTDIPRSTPSPVTTPAINNLEICKSTKLKYYYIAFILFFFVYTANVDEVRRAMSSFVLPPSATPTWAQNMPEEVWKTELLEGLRRQQQPPSSSTSNSVQKSENQ